MEKPIDFWTISLKLAKYLKRTIPYEKLQFGKFYGVLNFLDYFYDKPSYRFWRMFLRDLEPVTFY